MTQGPIRVVGPGAHMRRSSHCTARKPAVSSASSICILGGYGDVGLRVAGLLHAQTHARLLLVGRDAKRADTAALSIGPRCRGLALDVHDQDAAARLADAALCVNLTEATPPALAADLISNGTHFIDSSASPAYVADLEKTINALPGPRATAVLEAGLAPGLTNLLAARMCERHPDTRSIDILLELGMGVHHGLAATAWTLQALGRTYPMKSDGNWHEIRTGAICRHFTSSTENILGIGFAFSDQRSIARDLDLAGARTFLAISPGWMTTALRWLGRGPLRHVLRRNAMAAARIMQHLPTLGSKGTRLIIEGRNAQGKVIGMHHFSSGPQSDLTAGVIAQLALALMSPSTDPRRGLQPLGTFVDPASFAERM